MRVKLKNALVWIMTGLVACTQTVSQPTSAVTDVPYPIQTSVEVTSPPNPSTPTASAGTAVPLTAEQVFLPLIGLGALPPTLTPLPPTAAPAAPTAMPTSVWPEAINSLTASKLGIHALGTGDPYIMEVVRRARPRVLKSVGDYGWLSEVKAVSPETVTIGRIFGWEQDHWIETADPRQLAQDIVTKQLEQYRLNPGVDYWEGWNEFVAETPARMQWFAAFEAERACQMQANGFKAAVGGFSTGVPEFDLMDDFLPALEAAKRCGGIFHLHEYSAPTMDCGVVSGIPAIPGAPVLSVPAGPLALRYRVWYEVFLKPRGWGDLPLVISEAGIDKVSTPCDGQPGGTWRDFGGYWAARGLGDDMSRAYVNTLAWYDAQLRQDGYVIGATIFTAGVRDPENSWYAYDIHDVMIPLAFYLTSQR